MADEVTPDGSPVLLYRRLSAGEQPAIVDAAAGRPSEILELGAGAGRVTHPLLAFGHRVVAVDESAEMLRWITGAETVCAKIEGLDLGRKFDVVLLASHFLNTPDEGERRALLATCARHARPLGIVLLEHHPADWAETAAESESEREGIKLALTDVRRHPPFVSAVAEYVIDGVVYRQPFTARMFSAEELATELAAVGLRVSRQIDARWTEAVPADRAAAADADRAAESDPQADRPAESEPRPANP